MAVVRLWSRTRRNWAKDFPLIGAAMASLPVESVIIDGEAVCLLEDGRPDFRALRSRHACRDARLIAYDLLGLDGEDLRRLPLHGRRAQLEGHLSGNDVVRFSDHVEGRKGAALFRRACAMGLEGIVSKRIDAHLQIRAVPRLAQDQMPRLCEAVTCGAALTARAA